MQRLLNKLCRDVMCAAFVAFLGIVSTPAHALFSQCPAIGRSPGCSILITINPNGRLTFQVDASVLTLPLKSVPNSRVTNWLAWVDWQASLARTSSG